MKKKIRMLEADKDKNEEKKMRCLEKSIESEKPHIGNIKGENIENFLENY